MEENMSKEQIAELIRGVRAQEPQAFPQLLEQYKPLINACVSHYMTEEFAAYADDFRQEANIALHQAALAFRLEQGSVTFGLFAKICIENALVSYARWLMHHVQKLAELSSEGEGGCEKTPEDWVVSEESYRDLLTRTQALLSPFENRVWSMFVSGFKPKEIARVLGKEHRSIENAVYRIRCKLRKGLQ
jgi:RNA polymerase sporulation-specific sigma factor